MRRSGLKAGMTAVLALSLALAGMALLDGDLRESGTSVGLLPSTGGSSSALSANLEAGAAETHNCRFWGCISPSVPASVIEDHLILLPNSIKNLGPNNPQGWSVTCVSAASSEAVVKRGLVPAHLDVEFDKAVAQAASSFPRLAISHIRRCTSGLCDIPNPHPFERHKNGRQWFMAHNGTIDKNILLGLIRPEYLAENPPENGDYPAEWIDSELYFLYMLQTLEDYSWQLKPALGEVIQTLCDSIPGEGETLNFILTDGISLWAYRQGATLFYLYEPDETPYTAVASQFPSTLQEDWVELTDGELISMTPDAPPLVESIAYYFPRSLPAGLDPAAPPAGFLALDCRPNPFREMTSITYAFPSSGADSPVTLGIYDARGRLVRMLADGRQPAGERTVSWDGTDRLGRRVSGGLYFCRVESGGRQETRRLVLVP